MADDTRRPAAGDEAGLFRALRDQLSRVVAQQPVWRDRLAGIDPAGIGTRAELAALPLLRKSDLVGMQAADAPFGGLTGTEASKLARLFISPGPVFDPEGRGEDWWNTASALRAAGIGPGDIVLNTFSYHLTPAGAMFETGAKAVGCAVIPAGPGNTADQIVAIRQFRPTVYVGVPDFLKIILDKADEAGVDTGQLRCAILSGAALPPSLRAVFEARGIRTVECYGTADLGLVAFQDGGDGLRVNGGLIVEIVRPGTGAPVPAGEVGEVVVTRLDRDYPLIRFATGDLSRLLHVEKGSAPRLAGWMGRADQATKVKGMFVRPEQIAAVGKALGIEGRMRLVVTRKGENDVMTLMIEHPDATLADRAGEALSQATRLKGSVEIVAPGSLPDDGIVIKDERAA